MVVNERRFKYEGQVKQDPLNYDAWFDYIRLEESAGDQDKIREVSSPSAAHGHLTGVHRHLLVVYCLFLVALRPLMSIASGEFEKQAPVPSGICHATQ